RFCFCLPVEVISWQSNTDELVENYDEVKIFNNFNGINILVVEDNPINQEVLLKILGKVGINVDTAINGIECIKKFQENRDKYDLILMDIQMPIMDGYAATLKIREMNKNIPIIALTAAAMIEDRIKAIESGMTDHLPKPVDKNRLFELISKYVNIEIAYKDDKKELINDNNIIDMKKLIDTLDSEETAYTILSHFKESLLYEDFKDIISLLNSKEPDAHKLVHTLKGVSGNIRATKLFEICQKIDQKYKNNEYITESDISELENSIKEILTEIDILIERYNNINNEKTDPTDLDPYNRVLKLIKNSDTIDENLMKDFINFLGDKVSKVDIKLFEKYIKDSNYKMAIEVMEGWQLF
ncbi:MAG: response regulator, partial [Calditerrivibrio sp.]|nr:response regulator [Calditerrivibrio sp.]